MSFIYRDAIFKNENGSFITENLRGRFGYEISLRIGKHEPDAYGEVLAYLIDYLLDCDSVIKPNETIGYYSWLLKFVEQDGVYIIHEVLPDGSGCALGADYAIEVTGEQSGLCFDFDATPDFPTFNQMVAISEGVLEGYKIDASRYKLEPHMTGWFLVTGLYDGDYKKMKTVHFEHLAFARPDLLKYFALPAGYTIFEGENGIDIEFVPSLLEDEE